MPDVAAPLVSVIIPSHDGRAWLARCLPRVSTGVTVSHEVVVCDNGSNDGTGPWLQAEWPGVRATIVERPLGFAAACNQGARMARGGVLVFLNNDTEPEPGWLDHLVAPVLADPSRTVTTARLVRHDDPSVVDSAGDEYAWWGAPFKRGSGGPVEQHLEPRGVFSPSGAACAVGRERFFSLDGFDEGLESICEDVDFGYRVRLQGGECRYVPEAVVRHAGSATLGVQSANAVRLHQRNLEWVWWANTPWPLLVAMFPLHAAYEVLAAAFFLKRGRFRAFAAGKREAISGWRLASRKRARTMAGRRVSALALLRAMSAPPLLGKWREKRAVAARAAL